MAKVNADINQALGTGVSVAGSYMFFLIKKTLKAAGWKVMESSDATTYVSYRPAGTTGADQITHQGSGAGGMDNNNAWYVLQDPGGRREIMLHRQASGRVGTFAYSALDKFITGAPGPTTPSTADDRQILINNGNFWSARTVEHRFQGCAETVPIGNVYPFWFWQSEADDGTAGGLIALEAVAGPVADADPDPCVLMWGDNNSMTPTHLATQSGSAAGAYGWYKMNDGAEAWVKMVGHLLHINAVGEPVPGYVTHSLGTNPFGGKDLGGLITFGREIGGTGPGPKGRSTKTMWAFSSRSWPDTFTVGGGWVGEIFTIGERWAFVGDTSAGCILMPYPDGVSPTHDTASTDHAGEFWDTQVSEAVDPIVTLVSPPEGRINRHDALTVDVTDLSGFARVVVMAMFPSTSGPWEVAHDGLTFGPGYTGSERSTIPGGFRYTLRRDGGWFADPTLRVIAIDAKGNVEGA